MRTMSLICARACLVVLTIAALSVGAAPPSTRPTTRSVTAPPPSPTAVTHHTLTIENRSIDYTAVAGFLPITDDGGKNLARMFFVAYFRDSQPDLAKRPITFAFNGGPGASSIWLHLGGLGPKYLPFPNDGKTLPASPRLADNPYTWLEFSDLVFIDPVGSGFSRAVPGVNPNQFFEVEGDTRSVAQFIRTFLTHYNRWLSPKFITGESYGATRAAALAGHLQDKMGLYIDGVIFISAVLDFRTILFEPGNDLPYALAVPSFATTAWYHKKLSPELQKDFNHTVERARQWAMTDYLVALAKGDTLSDAERKKIIDQFAAFTGLAPSFIDSSNLRVSTYQFVKELLRGEDRVLGLMDSRVVGYDLNRPGEYARYDPSFFMTIGPLNAAINHYVRNDLQFQTDLPFEYLNRQANQAWKFEYQGNSYVNVAPTLREAMIKNYHLRVLIVGGYYDLTTPYFTNVYAAQHMDMPPALRKNIQFAKFPSGHQIYTPFPILRQLSKEANRFITNMEP